MDPTRSREISSCSAIDFAEIRCLPKLAREFDQYLLSGYCLGSSRTRRITGGNSPRLWWHTLVHVPLMFLSEWREFTSAPCLAGKKMTAPIPILLKSRTLPDMLPFSLYSKKRLALRYMNRPFFPKTLSIPSYDIGKQVAPRTYQHPSY